MRRPADEVWALVGDPGRIAEWFPGIVGCTVEGDSRVITTVSGLSMPEKIVTLDPLQRRFQYQLTGAVVREHLSTLDVIDLGDGTTELVYSVDADPATMALVIAGAGGNAIDVARRLLEGGP